MTKRVYETVSRDDGFRVLVDRLWPRGVRKEAAALDAWHKELAPSEELRTWFSHDPKKFALFTKRYVRELNNNAAVEEFLREVRRQRRTTLLYAAKDPAVNHAVVLQGYLLKRREP